MSPTDMSSLLSGTAPLENQPACADTLNKSAPQTANMPSHTNNHHRLQQGNLKESMPHARNKPRNKIAQLYSPMPTIRETTWDRTANKLASFQPHIAPSYTTAFCI
eukprot:9911505-Ditylum_brightwellii.AAC.3